VRKIGIVLGAMGLLATSPLHAAEVIAVEKLSADQAAKAIAAASDDTVIEINGQSKTKAQWRSDFEVGISQLNAKLKLTDDQAKAKSAADAKALQDQQDAAIAKRNAQTEKEFEALSSQ
jgi:hypothetical protein